MNHGRKISRNHEFSRLKPWNHESREIVKGIMNHERIIPSIFEAGDYNHINCLAFDKLNLISFPAFPS